MRIIAGEMRSRRLKAPEGMDTRPTADRAKEALFSILGEKVIGARVLDLYAGSGANGLEALSRGMDTAVFVDVSYEACGVIRSNIASLGVKERTRVLKMKDLKALELLKEEGLKFSIVYLDPPYSRQHNDLILEKLVEYDLLEDDAYAVIESAKEDSFEQTFGTLKPVRDRIYGITRITYYRNQKEEM
jgi:16S rRNA (guanine966-N2)-methyltransferase